MSIISFLRNRCRATPTLPSLISAHDLDILCELAASAPLGDIVELGVYRGGSACRLYDVAERQGRTLHLFDTFAGHPSVTNRDDVHMHPKGRFADAVDPHALARLLPRATIHIGEFPRTLPTDLTNIAFVHCDADLYEPTFAACLLLPSRMVDGGMLYFDDYAYAECPGVRHAVTQVFDDGRVLPNGKALITVHSNRAVI